MKNKTKKITIMEIKLNELDIIQKLDNIQIA